MYKIKMFILLYVLYDQCVFCDLACNFSTCLYSEYASDLMNTSTIFKEQSINWTRCSFCQEGKVEKLQCPADSKGGNVGAGYQMLVENL